MFLGKTKILEAEIDDVRIEIEHDLYGGRLIPESRGDVLGILESPDDVADSAKEIVIALASFLVLFVFASENLQNLMKSIGLPPFPLVPVSSSQAAVGAVLGVGLAKGGRNIRLGALGRIGAGWIATPLIAALVCFVALYFMDNVFLTRDV